MFRMVHENVWRIDTMLSEETRGFTHSSVKRNARWLWLDVHRRATGFLSPHHNATLGADGARLPKRVRCAREHGIRNSRGVLTRATELACPLAIMSCIHRGNLRQRDPQLPRMRNYTAFQIAAFDSVHTAAQPPLRQPQAAASARAACNFL